MSGKRALCVVPGDGVGPEVTAAAVAVLQAVVPDLKVSFAEAGWAVFERTGTALPGETLEAARATGCVLFGAVSSPSHPVPGYSSPIVALRRKMSVFANLRPSLGWPVAGSDPRLDLLVVRENTEGMYSGRERLEGDTAITERIITRVGTERVARMAFTLAAAGHRKVTIVHKANVVRVGDGLWRSTCLEVAADFPQVAVEDGLVDSVAHNLIRQPDRYRLLLCPNLYGDILSDVAAALGGGLGMAPSISLGEQFAIAEPVHGSAPDIAGRGIANPIGAILSASLLARHVWDLASTADRIDRAVHMVLASGRRTADLAEPGERALDTKEMTEAILTAVAG